MKIGIVHYGEDVATDPGYRPLRYGHVAREWTLAGHEVTRFTPTFSHLRRAPRPHRSVDRTAEGRVRTVRTPSYGSSRGLRRAAFLAVWLVGSAIAMRRSDREIDAFLVGHPPPGTTALYRLIGGRRTVVLDIRDAWFSGSSRTAAAMRWALRGELRFVTRVTALSRSVAAWTNLPDERLSVVPIGVDRWAVDEDAPSTTLRCVFIGTLNDRFSLQSWIRRWPTDGTAQLDIYGSGPMEPTLAELAADRSSVNVLGPVPSDVVPDVLARYDVGIAPTVPGFGTNISNKVAEYLSAGLFVVHSLGPEPARFLDAHALGRRVDDDGLAATLAELTSGIEPLRDARSRRQHSAWAATGWPVIADALLDQLRGAA